MKSLIIFALLVPAFIVFGGLLSSAYSDHTRNECLKLVADKSSADIQVICGVKK